MSSQKKMLAVLDVFTPAQPLLTAEEMMARLGYSRGTAYRYIRELCDAGLLARVGGAYGLGPRIIELDFNIRQWDPVLRASQTVMQQLRDKFDCDVLLTSFYENHVVVSHHERGAQAITMSYGRGRVMPLFRGAPSKIILAFLPPARQERLYNAHRKEIAAVGLGNDWPEFRRKLSDMRRAGTCTSFGELDPDNVGVAAPIFYDPTIPPGSIVLVFSRKRYAVTDTALVEKVLRSAVEHITRLIKHIREPDKDEMLWLAPAKG